MTATNFVLLIGAYEVEAEAGPPLSGVGQVKMCE
jgi:hypothetical protein